MKYVRVLLLLILAAASPALASDANTRLMSAASHGDLDGVKAAIEDGADVDYYVNPFNDQTRASALQMAATQGYADVVALLLKRGANVNITDNTGDTPLIAAFLYGKKDVVKLLVANGADVRHAGQYGQTPLHWAASNGDLDSAKLLLDRGANINAMNADSETPLDDADSALVADFLLAHGAHIGGFSDDATPLSSVDRDLFTAAVTGNVERIRSAVSHGAHVNIRDRNHGTPLIRAALLGRVDAAAQPY